MFRILAVCVAIVLSGCSYLPPKGIEPVSPFDLQRYLGQWYEIARLDHSFERGLSDIGAPYSLNDDGSVRVVNRGYDSERGQWKDAVGRAVFTGDSNKGALKVSFFGPFYGGYNVIALDPDYRWSMVMGPDRSYLWILSRDKRLPDNIRDMLVQKARAVGVDTDKLIWVSHTRDR